MKLRTLFMAMLVGCLVAVQQPTIYAATAGPSLTVNVAAERHAISPDIYGMNDNPWDIGLGSDIRLPVSRWGGDATTCYNWKVDASNSGGDWYFMAGSGNANPVPSASADAFVSKILGVGGKALLTIPVIDYINSATSWNCSFPVSLFGPQQSVNPYVQPIVNGQATQAGNGVTTGGTDITLTVPDILRVYKPNTPAQQTDWIKHMIAKFGTAANGGVAIYQMDNEPSGWGNTHRDIHPAQPSYETIVNRTLPYAEAVKAADPSAAVLGPSDFGWAVYQGNPANNGGLGNAEYYLMRFRKASQTVGKRLLDYFDEHYYPTAQTGQDNAIQLESTRSLWDPTYVEQDWIGQYYGAIDLIPRMRGWVNKYYPGTKLAITEYNWGGLNTLNGALAQADVLGIFGRENLDLATIWGTPTPTDPGAFSFLIYRNYDGQGSSYGDTWVKSVSADQSQVAIYGAQRTSDLAVTLIVINKTTGDLACPLALAGFRPASTAQVYNYSAANLSALVREPDVAVTSAGFTADFPASSITLIVLARH